MNKWPRPSSPPIVENGIFRNVWKILNKHSRSHIDKVSSSHLPDQIYFQSREIEGCLFRSTSTRVECIRLGARVRASGIKTNAYRIYWCEDGVFRKLRREKHQDLQHLPYSEFSSME